MNGPTNFFQTDAASTFFFMSARQALSTQGCLEEISLPAANGFDPKGPLQTTLREAFERARRQGIEKPCVVGAIPFNSQEPSALFIPGTSQRLSVDEARHQASKAPVHPLAPISHQEVPDQADFMAMVEAAKQAFARGEADKLVLSRLLQADVAQPPEHRTLLARLLQQHTTGYQFDCPLPGGHRLVGASPELLVSKSGDRLRSQPLAGSARRSPEQPAQDREIAARLLVSSKDRYEHQIVIQAVQKVLAAHCSELTIPEAPELIHTPLLWHLATTIEGTSAANALALACLLHPTPALSGFPHAMAVALLEKLEPFKRHFFGGIVGWCDAEGNGEWAIAIRCAELAPHQLTLFAGAGIVPASDPLSEWQETGTKLMTMQRALGLA